MELRTRTLALAAALAALLVLLLVAAERTVALAQRLADLPPPLRWLVAGLLVVFACAAVWVAWLLLKPRRKRAPQAVDRADIDARVRQLDERGADTSELRGELRELDVRRDQACLYVALFGEISSGKSSLVAALARGELPMTDVVGGSTRSVAHYDATLPGGTRMRLADVPGSQEAGGEQREALARDEALRAHAVVYVAHGDLSRTQAEELRWLGEFGKPMLLALNKVDQWSDAERSQLVQHLRQRLGKQVDAIVTTSAGGSEQFQRMLADGRTEQVERSRAPHIDALQSQLQHVTAPGAAALEQARERAVLAGLHEKTGRLEASQRQAEAQRIVARYTRRAVVGALASVAPGSDLVIQGTLATLMARELGRLFDVPVSDLQIEDFLKQARMNLRTSTTVVLAIAGNAMKAFPGVGTLSGGVVHAFAYALIFDSLGKALSETLVERQELDVEAAGSKLQELLREANGQRLRRLAALTVDAARHGDEEPRD